MQLALGVAAELCALLQPARLAVDLDPVLDHIGPTPEGGLPGGPDTLAVLGMDAREEVGVSDARACGDPEQAVGFLRPFERLGVGAFGLDAPAADAGDGLGLTQQGLVAGQPLLGLQAQPFLMADLLDHHQCPVALVAEAHPLERDAGAALGPAAHELQREDPVAHRRPAAEDGANRRVQIVGPQHFGERTIERHCGILAEQVEKAAVARLDA